MELIGTLIVGLIVGAIAKFLMPGSDPGGWIMTIVLGIAGSFVGNFIAGALGMAGPVGGSARSWARCCCCSSTGSSRRPEEITGSNRCIPPEP